MNQFNNTSNQTFVYSMKFTNVVNTFNPLSEFVYSVKRNGVVVKQEEALPTTDSYIVEHLLIPGNTSYEYEIDYRFVETYQVQNYQLGKTFKAKVEVEAN